MGTPNATEGNHRIEPLRTFTVDGITYRRRDDGLVEMCSWKDGLKIGGADVYHRVMLEQYRLIHFFQDHAKGIRNAVALLKPFCDDARSLIENFPWENSQRLLCITLDVEGSDSYYGIGVADSNQDGLLDELQVHGSNTKFVGALHGNSFHPLIAQLLEIGVQECVNLKGREETAPAADQAPSSSAPAPQSSPVE